ncbi:hypothetical protein GBF38_014825 [Nibea albiflora]|nr:hypothetical protein GBF38_014825 [Nibea albiflora]
MLWRTGSQLPVIPEEPELDVIVENISTHDPEPSNTPQQAPISKATNPAEAFFQQTGVKMIAVPEIDFMEDRSEEISKLEKEQAALLKEVEQLREMLQTQRALQAQEESKYQARVKTLQLEISNTETSEKEALCKVSELEEALKKEISHQSDIETSMSDLRVENSRLVAALTQAEEDTKMETIQWKEEKSNLLSNIKKEQQTLQDEMNRATLMDSADNQSGKSSGVVATLVQAEEELKQETLQEEEEESSLLQTISAQQQALENDMTSNQVQAEEGLKQDVLQWEEQKADQQQQPFESGTSRDENQDRHDGPEEQVAAILNRPRRPSLWKRFKRLFKRTARPPVSPPVPPPSSQPS